VRSPVGLSVLLPALAGLSVPGRGSATAAAPTGPEGPNVKVALLADHDSVAAGGSVTLGLNFKIPNGWHIYWRFAGDSGLPPRVTWTLPQGAGVGQLRFPVPERHVDKAGLTTYILEGQPVLLADFTAPPTASPGTSLRVQGEVAWLVCKEACVMQQQTVSLDLPVVDAADRRKPANQELFESALAALPAGMTDSKYVKVSTALNASAVRPGDEVEAALVLDVASGHHIQSNKPASEFFIPTELIVEPAEGLEPGAARFPPPRVRTDRAGQRQSEFAGRTVIRIPLKANAGLAADQPLRGLVRFQVCNDETGVCFPPETVDWSLRVPLALAGQTAERANADLFSAAAPVSGDGEGGPDSPGAGRRAWPLWKILLGAFIGGVILNIMPCVLPVISIKVLSFVQQAGDDPRRVFRLGLTYGAGILASFLVMAIGVLVLQRQGKAAGWGYIMASPAFVQAMIVVVFGFGLSLFGVFTVTLPGSTTTALGAAEEREGYPGAFLKGVLATALATPCTAPFLAPALGFAFALPSLLMVLSLMTVGAGLAAPYVVLTAVPGWMRFLPKPGLWMERFKQFMGFVLMGTVVWLLWILSQLGDPARVIWIVAFCCFVGLSLWLIGLQNVNTASVKRAATWLSAIAISAGGFFYCFLRTPVNLEWRDWRPGLAEQLASQGYTVYVDFTASWCATCQANKKLVLESGQVRDRLATMQVVLLKADYTRYDPAIAAELKRYGRAGVPLNIILPANRPAETILLPELLTKGIVLAKLKQAGPSLAGKPPELAASGSVDASVAAQTLR